MTSGRDPQCYHIPIGGLWGERLVANGCVPQLQPADIAEEPATMYAVLGSGDAGKVYAEAGLMAKTRAEIACAPYVDAWRDGFKAGQLEGFQYCLDLVRAVWMDLPDKRIEQIGKEIADELKRRQAA